MQSTLDLLKYALDFETAGCEFYRRAAERVTDPISASVLKALAADEADHKWTIGRYYEAMANHQGWPSGDIEGSLATRDAIRMLRDTVGRTSPDADCMTVYKEARELEFRALDFYRREAESAADDRLAHFLKFLAKVEETHVNALDLLIGASCEVS
jgi:rubrerythrin